MSLNASPAMSPRLGRGLAAAVSAVAVGLCGAVGAVGAAAAESGEAVRKVEGTVVLVVLDDHEPGEGSAVGQGTPVEKRLEVDGRLYTLPELATTEAQAGDEVVVTLAGATSLSAEQALAEVVDAGADPAARVLDITVTAQSDSSKRPTSDLATGVHTLVILPVYWSSRDAATSTSLQQAANSTAAYWERQSGNRIDIQPTVRDWKPIANPGSCDDDAIFAQALAAHGEAEPSPTRHVAVYFPDTLGCSYAGRADVGGGYIWISGPSAGYTFYVLAHELGHNLGLGHANTLTCFSGSTRVALSDDCDIDEYGDNADVMGQGTNGTPGNLSAAFADQLGYAHLRTFLSPPAATTAVDIAPIAAVGSLRALKLSIGWATLYVEYRPAVSPDLHEPGWAGVQVRLLATDGWGIPETYLLDLQPQRPVLSAVNLPIGASWAVPDTGFALSTTATSSSGARVTVAPTGEAARIQRYVVRVYQDLFERSVDPSGLHTWTTALQSGTPRVAVANSITYSAEYRSRLITESYRHYLGRAPDAAGLQHWLGTMAAGYTIERMEAGFLASPEYYAKAGSTPAGWVRELYRHVLNRGAGEAEVRHWTTVLARGGSRNSVAMGFLLSTEHLTTVVDGYYRELLGRGIDPSGRATWVSRIQAGGRVEAIIGGIIASEEYYAKV